MCNLYQLRANLHTICSELLSQPAFDFEVPAEVFPKSPAPVVVLNRDNQREVRPMIFGLGGASKSGATGSPRSAASTYVLNNARIESHDKWPWKKPFEKFRCVVPMTSFREASYWGECAGSELSFSQVEDRLLLAAGLFTFETTEEGENRFYMSILMRPAISYVMQHGHHRSPFFVRHEGVGDWISREPRSSAASLEILHDYADEPELTHEINRHMAASWTKRKKANLQKRDDQLAAIESTGPLGFQRPN